MVAVRIVVTFDKLIALLIIVLSFTFDFYFGEAKTTYFAIPAAAGILGVKKIIDGRCRKSPESIDYESSEYEGEG